MKKIVLNLTLMLLSLSWITTEAQTQEIHIIITLTDGTVSDVQTSTASREKENISIVATQEARTGIALYSSLPDPIQIVIGPNGAKTPHENPDESGMVSFPSPSSTESTRLIIGSNGTYPSSLPEKPKP